MVTLLPATIKARKIAKQLDHIEASAPRYPRYIAQHTGLNRHERRALKHFWKHLAQAQSRKRRG